jgi:hypothetical protein
MTDYQKMWQETANENIELYKQIDRLKGNSRENPTLRDQFAMASLPGLLAKSGHFVTAVFISESAYKIAEAMMIERNKVK